MSVLKSVAVFTIVLGFGVFGYFEALGLSTALHYPEFMEDKLQSGGKLDPIYYWGFVVVTLSLPYVVGVAFVSYVGARYVSAWIPVVAIFLALVYIRGLTPNIWYWISLLVFSVVVSAVMAYLSGKARYKTRQDDHLRGV